ncbi:MAG: alpha/beta fold hydrolase [Thermodesulfobacteriota bacterium]
MERKFDYFTTDDGLQIRYGMWPARKNHGRGSVFYLSGRAEFIEKNLETFDELLCRGFDVYTFDWRGQGLSDRLRKNRHKGYVGHYDDYLRDLHQFLQTVVNSKAVSPWILMGHSMGGHIGLRYIHDHPETFERAVILSPMIDINTFPFPRQVVRKAARFAIKTGLEGRYVFGAGDYDPRDKIFRNNPLTNDCRRFFDEIQEIENNPDLALGGVTYGWLAAAFASIDTVKKPGYAGQIRTPTAMISATADRVVSRKAQKHICRRMPRCRFIEIEGARHEILKETDDIRNRFWTEFDRFTGIDEKEGFRSGTI